MLLNRKTLLGGVLWLVLASCTPSRPVIIQTFSQVNLFSDTSDKQIKESLSLFLQVTNEDGFQDLSELHVLHDESELFWILNPTTWSRVDRTGEVWVGSNQLWMPQGDVFPRGRFRVELLNKAGDRGQAEFFLDSPTLKDYKKPLPQLSKEGEIIKIENAPSSYLLWVYGSERRLLTTYRGTKSQVNRGELVEDPKLRVSALEFYLYYYDESLGLGIVVGPQGY